MGKHLDKTIKKTYQILEIQDLLKDNLRENWTLYLDKKESWER